MSWELWWWFVAYRFFLFLCLEQAKPEQPVPTKSRPAKSPSPWSHNRPTISFCKGSTCLGQHDAAGAEKAFRQAIEVQPEVEPAHRGLALALREEGRLPEALRELQTATQLDPSDSDAHYTLGSVAWALSLPGNAPPGSKGG